MLRCCFTCFTCKKPCLRYLRLKVWSFLQPGRGIFLTAGRMGEYKTSTNRPDQHPTSQVTCDSTVRLQKPRKITGDLLEGPGTGWYRYYT